MTNEHTTDYLTMEQHQRQIALESAKAALSTGHPMGGRAVPEHRTTTDLVDLANFILRGEDPMAAWMRHQQPLEAVSADPGDTEAMRALWNAAETILQTGGAVEIHGVVIRRAEDEDEQPFQTLGYVPREGSRYTDAALPFLRAVAVERERQQQALGYDRSHDGQHTGGEWANLVTDYVAKALAGGEGHTFQERLVQAAAIIAAWWETVQRQEAQAQHPSSGEPEPDPEPLVHARKSGPLTWCGLTWAEMPQTEQTGQWDKTTCPDCQQAAPKHARTANGWDE